MKPEKIDELADLTAFWKKKRDLGITPKSVMSAIIMICEEITENNKEAEIFSSRHSNEIR